jgi:predicted phage terminase large subunit-like protein
MQDGGEKWDVVSFPAIACDASAGTPHVSVGSPHVSKGSSQVDILSPTGTNIKAQGQAAGRNPGYANDGRPLSEGEQQTYTDPLGRKPGDALWPERFPVEELIRIQRKLGSYSFAALYQQHPTPLEGGLFKKSWFKQIIPVAPQGLRWFRGYDLAISTKTSADYTASARCAMDRHGNIYIADVFRARLEYPDQRKFVIDRMMKERDTEHGIEFALHAQAFVQDLRRQANLARFAIKPVRVTSDKFTRALAWANRAEEGKIILVRGPWINTFLEEVCSFPNAPHDDQVDAVSLCVQMLDTRRRIVWRF